MTEDIFLCKRFQRFQSQSVPYIRDTCLVLTVKKSAVYKTAHQK